MDKFYLNSVKTFLIAVASTSLLAKRIKIYFIFRGYFKILVFSTPIWRILSIIIMNFIPVYGF